MEAEEPTAGLSAEPTRDRIKAVAIGLFTAQGYQTTSLREIADQVGITKASLYYHYPSKQALLLAIIQPFIDDWAAMVVAIEHLPHTPANVRFVLERTVDLMLRNSAGTAMFLRDVAAVVTALAPRLEELKQLGTRMYTWMAGPEPSPADQIRAMAAVDVLRTAVAAAATLPEAPQDEVRRVVLEAAAAVLGLDDRLSLSARPAAGTAA